MPPTTPHPPSTPRFPIAPGALLLLQQTPHAGRPLPSAPPADAFPPSPPLLLSHSAQTTPSPPTLSHTTLHAAGHPMCCRWTMAVPTSPMAPHRLQMPQGMELARNPLNPSHHAQRGLMDTTTSPACSLLLHN
jgi:hypothetical protein